MVDEHLITLREAIQRRVRFVRKVGWALEWMELPLIEPDGVGPWYSLHSRYLRVPEKVLYREFDHDAREWEPGDLADVNEL